MNKFFFTFAILLFFNFCTNIEVGETIKLPEPDREGGMLLYKALSLRKSSRNFDETKDISITTLSQALWSCYGIGETTSRTVPSSKGWYPFFVYAFLKDGVYQYNPETHELTKLFDGDHRSKTGTQTSVVTKAAVNLVFVGDLQKETIMQGDKIRRLACRMDMGHVSQNLYLFASANSMKGVVRGEFNEKTILDLFGFDQKNYYIPLCFSLGY